MSEKMHFSPWLSKHYSPKDFNSDENNMNKWCENFDVETVGDFNMIMWTSTEDVIVETHRLIRECLGCKRFPDCTKRHELVKILDANPKV